MPDDAAIGPAGFHGPPAGRGGPSSRGGEEDPVVRSGRREAYWSLSLWLAAAIYSVTYCTLWGYGRSVESLTFVLWFPDWVFWGIVVPWIACTVVSIYFALRVIEDDPLSSADDAATVDALPDDAPAGNASSPDRASDREAGDV